MSKKPAAAAVATKSPTKKVENKLPAKVAGKVPVKASDVDDSYFEQYAGSGKEAIVPGRDTVVPRITILQSLSPQISKKKPEYIEGAELGTICNVGTSQLFPDGMLFLPAYFEKQFLEWAPRSTGKGLITIHRGPDAHKILERCTRDEKNRPFLPNGNSIAETAQFYGFNLTAGSAPCFVPMASTQLKKAHKWNTMAKAEKLQRSDGSEFEAPLWYRTYMLTSAEESNNEGDWFGWKIDRGPTIAEYCSEHNVDFEELKEQCLAMIKGARSGSISGDVSDMEEARGGSSSNKDSDDM